MDLVAEVSDFDSRDFGGPFLGDERTGELHDAVEELEVDAAEGAGLVGLAEGFEVIGVVAAEGVPFLVGVAAEVHKGELARGCSGRADGKREQNRGQ